MVRILDFQQLLSNSSSFPEEADMDFLWDSFAETIEDLDGDKRLLFAGETFLEIACIIKERALSVFESIDSHNFNEGVILPDDFFDEFVRQNQSIDFSEFLVSPSRLLPRNITTSLVSLVDKQSLLQTLESETKTDAWQVSHPENISAWREAISFYLKLQDRPVSLTELQANLRMSLTEIWMGLLLGGEDWTIEQRGDFYDNEGIWIEKVDSSY